MLSKVCQEPVTQKITPLWKVSLAGLNMFCVFNSVYWLEDDLRSVVAKTIHYFNYIRPVRKLNGKPPIQFRIEQVV